MTPASTHNTLLGKENPPSELQAAFYESSAKGFASGEVTEEIADAVILSALSQVLEKPSPTYNQVLIFCTAEARALLGKRIWETAKTVVGRVAGTKDPILREKAVKHIKAWISAPCIGPIENWKKATPPDRWVSFGYSSESKIPKWMKDALH